MSTKSTTIKESRLRLNRDALAASRKLGLRSTFTGTTHNIEEEEEGKRPRTTPSSPTSNSFSRPPKSPLRLPPRYDENHEEYQRLDTPPLDMARSLSISSVNSSLSTAPPKTPKNASYRKEDPVVEESPLQETSKKSSRRLSSPAERKRQSHTFPNRNNHAAGSSSNPHHKKRNDLLMKEEGVAAPIIGGSLGHKLDRQYRETANEILSKKPSDDATDEKEEKLMLQSEDGLSTTHYVSLSMRYPLFVCLFCNSHLYLYSNWVIV